MEIPPMPPEKGVAPRRPPHAPHHGSPSEWLVGGGELGTMIRTKDWSGSPVGPRERWPAAMRTVLNLVVSNRLPMILSWGHEQLTLYNDAFREIAADRHPDLLGRSTTESWPEIWDISQPTIEAVMNHGSAMYIEDQLLTVRRNGRREEAFFTFSYSPVRAEDGAVVGTLVTLVETTNRVQRHRILEAQRERAEAASRRERELFAGVIERIPVMVNIYNPALHSYRVNQEVHRVLGWTEEDARGGRLMELCYPDPEYRAEVERFMAAAEPGWREFVVYAKDGSLVETAWANVRLSDSTQVGIGIDLRERKRAEATLRESEERYRTLFERIDEGFCVVEVLFDSDGRATDHRFLELNPGFERHTGLRNAQGKTAREVMPLLEREWSEIYGRIAMTGEPARFEQRSNALDRWLDVYGFRIGRPEERKVALVFSDITPRKEAEEEQQRLLQALRDVDRRKNEFLAVLSHELRNPLAPISNSIYILERATPGGEQAKRAVTVIVRQVTQMAHLIDDLLDVTRISKGKVRLQRESLVLNDIVRGTCDDFRDLFQRNGITFEVALPHQRVRSLVDRTRVAQSIGNVLQNAAKFTPPGGWVNLSLTTSDDGHAVIEVRDNGTGIDPHVMSRLFEPFVQADATLDRTMGGLGLGLALVKGLVEMHGGSVSAHSEGLGRGSVFTIRLPLEGVESPSRLPAPIPSGGETKDALRILIIEDNVDAATSLREALELSGHHIETASTGQEGLEKARLTHPDVVLCDIGLPGIDGFEVARRMRADPELCSASLVALSGYTSPEDLERSKEAGFVQHVAKPPDLLALESTLSQVSAPGRTSLTVTAPA